MPEKRSRGSLPHAKPDTVRFSTRSSAAFRIALVLTASLALGVLTAYAQEWLPQELGSLANTSGTWALVGFALARLARDARTAALIGALSLISLLAGYVLGSEARGFPAGNALMLFWGIAALLVGPVLGLSSYWTKTRRDELAGVGIGAMSGVLVGEGLYGLIYIADTTYGPYWLVETVVGLALLAWVLLTRLRSPRPAAAAIGVAILTAAGFVLIYSRDLIAALP